MSTHALLLRLTAFVGLCFVMVGLPGADQVRAAGSINDRCLRDAQRSLIVGASVRVLAVRESAVACLNATGERTVLGRYSTGGTTCYPNVCTLGPFAVAGPLAAYAVNQDGRSRLRTRIVVRDLRRKRVLVDQPNGTTAADDRHFCDETDVSGIGPTRTLRLRSDGAVAWVAGVRCVGTSTPTYAVYAKARNAESEQLVVSPDVVPGSLRMTRRDVSWVQNGERVSRPLMTVAAACGSLTPTEARLTDHPGGVSFRAAEGISFHAAPTPRSRSQRDGLWPSRTSQRRVRSRRWPNRSVLSAPR